MVSFKGRIWFIQYLPKKPNKWGLKAYVLADSKTGYTYNWSLYTGKCYSCLLFLNIKMYFPIIIFFSQVKMNLYQLKIGP